MKAESTEALRDDVAKKYFKTTKGNQSFDELPVDQQNELLRLQCL